MSTEQRVTKQYILDHIDEDELDLSLCSLTSVPVKELKSVHRGRKVDLSQNKLTEIPESFSILTFIYELDLSKNQLSYLPENFGELSQLQKLDLFGNQLEDLPLSFSNLSRLKWLDLRANRLNPDLVKTAGDCSSEKECNDCAINVVKFMTQRVHEEEGKHKKQEEKRKARARKREREKQKVAVEAKKMKQQEKLKRRKHWEENQQSLPDKNIQSISEGRNLNEEISESTREGVLMKCLIFLLFILIALFITLLAIFWEPIIDMLVNTNFYNNHFVK